MKERICFLRIPGLNSFLSELINFIGKGNKYKNGRVASPESVSIHRELKGTGNDVLMGFCANNEFLE